MNNAANMLYAIILKFGLPQAQHKPNFKTTHIAFRVCRESIRTA